MPSGSHNTHTHTHPQARLNNLRGTPKEDPFPPAAEPFAGYGIPAAPQPVIPNNVIQSAETTFHLRRIEELETENSRLKHEVVAANLQAENHAKEMHKYQQAVQLLQSQLAANKGHGAPAGGAGILTPRPGFEPSINDMQDAQKFSKFVASALQFKDTANARENLMKSLAKINGHPI